MRTGVNKDSAMVVLSGGQDSSTCLFWAKRHFREVTALTFAYGQKHKGEVECAKEIARIAGVEHRVMDAGFVNGLARNSLTDAAVRMEEELPAEGLPNTFVPGRNLFFLSIAAVCARECGINHIVTGTGQTDYSGYPDCRDAFVKSLNVTLNLSMEWQFVLHTPLMWLDKCQTWAMADKLGVMKLIEEETLTCYNNVKGEGCGHCLACKLRREGKEEYLRRKAAGDEFKDVIV